MTATPGDAPRPGTTLRRNWPAYLMEAWGLATFMLSATLCLLVLEHPGSPVHQAMPSKGLRLVTLGLVMGLVVAGISYAPWGKRSGAHINPAVTWAFYRLGKISGRDALFYTLAQFLGATVIIQGLELLVGRPFRHPAIGHAMSKPGPGGPWVAFAAEFAMCFVLMLVLLWAVNRPKLEKWAGAMLGGLIALYLAVETPLSGMSLNPARTFGSALAAGEWKNYWVYLLAPPLAMLAAAELYLRRWPHQLGGPRYPTE